MRGRLVTAATKTSIVLALLGLTTPAVPATAQPAQVAQLVHARTVLLPLNGTFDEEDAEPIDITGSIRVTVVTRTAPGGGGTARIVSNLGRTIGIGEDTGARYRFAGADIDTVAYPPDPVTPLTIRPTFLKFWPPGPIVPPNPIQPVEVNVTLAANGTINSITAEVDDGDSGGDIASAQS
ncbi:hypothetical protein [Streptomyces cadmiisoli]|uniref:Uncharacterized protein n=1 Tax=Streptomyces cadmiisoli TaxID=2184053 RepID=A0A2Z4JA34_9ACTN|nr:hypothetical protein [Streptomyces cadmiisoli]AWW41975.1 hypothetical protein DN051_39625 [Streptomyces cadmiisoli]